MSTYNNESQNNSQENSKSKPSITFYRCPHDRENPYAQISNNLIRDGSLSPNCRWLIIYLLSNKESFGIKIEKIIEHLRPTVGRDKFYKILNEGIDAGYIKRDVYKENNLTRVRYFVSEEPKFKESLDNTEIFLRLPENQDTEIQDPENTDAGRIYRKLQDRKRYKKIKEKDDAGASVSACASTSTPSFSNPISQEKKEAHEKKQVIPKASSGKSSFSSEVISATEILVDLTRQKTEYIVPNDTTGWQKEVKLLLEDENRDRHQVIKTFTWCLTASWYSSQLLKKRKSSNPIKYFRENYAELAAKMLEKPFEKERKFSPSSKREDTDKMAEEMMSRAIY